MTNENQDVKALPVVARMRAELFPFNGYEVCREEDRGSFAVVRQSDAESALAELRAEVEELDALRNRMADLLSRTAVALKGEQAPLTRHGWHDLPDLAQQSVTTLAEAHIAMSLLKQRADAADAAFAEASGLLNEVRSRYTRDDDLPDRLLPRIDALLGEGNG